MQAGAGHQVKCHYVEEAERSPVRERVMIGLSGAGAAAGGGGTS